MMLLQPAAFSALCGGGDAEYPRAGGRSPTASKAADDTDAGKQSSVYRSLPDTLRSTTVRGAGLR
jgi:hypothetical protein